MQKVKNKGCIRRLSQRSLAASRGRNAIAVLAIALTAVLFTSVFTIALSMNRISVRWEGGLTALLKMLQRNRQSS